MTSDPYSDRATGVLSNLLGISDVGELADAEREITAAALFRIGRERIPGSYDLRHLCAFHQAIFGEVYPWAGRVRQVAIARTALFALPQHIESYAAAVLGELASEDHLRGLVFDRFTVRVAHYLAEINAIHPFREGNGRAQRAFFSQLAADAGWRIHWERMDASENVDASVASMHGDEQPLTSMLAGLIQPDTIWPPFS